MSDIIERLQNHLMHPTPHVALRETAQLLVDAKFEIERMRQYLETIRDTGLTAEEAMQHARDALE